MRYEDQPSRAVRPTVPRSGPSALKEPTVPSAGRALDDPPCVARTIRTASLDADAGRDTAHALHPLMRWHGRELRRSPGIEIEHPEPRHIIRGGSVLDPVRPKQAHGRARALPHNPTPLGGSGLRPPFGRSAHYGRLQYRKSAEYSPAGADRRPPRQTCPCGLGALSQLGPAAPARRRALLRCRVHEIPKVRRSPSWQQGGNTPPETNRKTLGDETAEIGLSWSVSATDRNQPRTPRRPRNEGSAVQVRASD